MKISDVLVQDHITIKKWLTDYQKAADPAKKETLFLKLQQKLTQHLYQEERAAIVYCEGGGNIDMTFINALTGQHDKVLAALDKWEVALKAKKDYDVSGLIKDLEKHISFEMDSFYLELDAQLDEIQMDRMAHAITDAGKLKKFPFDQNRSFFSSK